MDIIERYHKQQEKEQAIQKEYSDHQLRVEQMCFEKSTHENEYRKVTEIMEQLHSESEKIFKMRSIIEAKSVELEHRKQQLDA